MLILMDSNNKPFKSAPDGTQPQNANPAYGNAAKQGKGTSKLIYVALIVAIVVIAVLVSHFLIQPASAAAKANVTATLASQLNNNNVINLATFTQDIINGTSASGNEANITYAGNLSSAAVSPSIGNASVSIPMQINVQRYYNDYRFTITVEPPGQGASSIIAIQNGSSTYVCSGTPSSGPSAVSCSKAPISLSALIMNLSTLSGINMSVSKETPSSYNGQACTEVNSTISMVQLENIIKAMAPANANTQNLYLPAENFSACLARNFLPLIINLKEQIDINTTHEFAIAIDLHETQISNVSSPSIAALPAPANNTETPPPPEFMKMLPYIIVAPGMFMMGFGTFTVNNVNQTAPPPSGTTGPSSQQNSTAVTVSSMCIFPSTFSCAGAKMSTNGTLYIGLKSNFNETINLLSASCNLVQQYPPAGPSSTVNLTMTPGSGEFGIGVRCYSGNVPLTNLTAGAYYTAYVILNYTVQGMPRNIIGKVSLQAT